MNPHVRWSSAALLAVTLLLAACGGTQKPPTLSGPQSAPASPTEESLTTESPSAQPSPSAVQPTKANPSPKTAVVKNVDWYTSHRPTFGPLPEPQVINVDAGTSSPLWFKVPTTQKVAFLTIDDGALRHPLALPLLKASGVRVTLFLTIMYVEKYPEYFKALQAAGAVIEDHTFTHTDLRGKSYEFQYHEICEAADRLGQIFGRRPTLFRPPYGDYDANTLKIARSCGLKVVFYWTETIDKGIVRFQTSNHTIQPGHVMLMHFRPAYGDDFLAALNRMKQSGVQPALLEDYIEGAH